MNEDEVEFLDSVLESTRAKEAAVKKQTAEDLDAFRRQQEEAERAAKTTGDTPTDTADTTNWAVSRKRKKGREDILGGVKLRKASSGEKAPSEVTRADAQATATQSVDGTSQAERDARPTSINSKGEGSTDERHLGPGKDESSAVKTTPSNPAPGLGLGAYSTDEDD